MDRFERAEYREHQTALRERREYEQERFGEMPVNDEQNQRRLLLEKVRDEVSDLTERIEAAAKVQCALESRLKSVEKILADVDWT